MTVTTDHQQPTRHHVPVTVVGAGPVGLLTAIELRRRGIEVLIVDRRTTAAQWAKAVGVQPRTLEVFDAMGVGRAALDAATALRGQLTYSEGIEQSRLNLVLPDAVPYRFVALPQYDTERVLSEHLALLGVQVRRDCEVTGIEPDPDGVTVRMLDSGTEVHVRAGYVVGCDGAHSTVRQQLGVDFPGDEIPEAYMLADVEVDWDLPTGYAVRCTRRGAEREEILMCVPLPGAHRYRMSMLAAQDLLDHPSGQEPGGGPRQAPQLRHIQDVVDRLSPQPAWVHSMRWSSVFRMSHRLAQRYSVGRVFLAGDAAHVHPPTGAQGMNTGLQDAYNLGWKLAMVLSGDAAPSLLDSYHVERHPVGEEVVGRTTRASRTAAGAGDDRGALAVLREAQLLVAYPDSPLNAPDTTSEHLAEGPPPGNRAPDAGGLRQDCLAGSLRWHEMLRHPLHTLLLWAAGPAAVSEAEALARRVADLAPGLVRAYIAVPGATPHVNASGHVLADGGGALGAAYGFAPAVSQVQGYLIRPDGYVGYRSSHPAADELVQHLRTAYGSPTRHAAMAQTS